MAANNLVLELLIRARDGASNLLERIRNAIGGLDNAATVAKVGLAALAAGLVAVAAAFKQGLSDAADFETILARVRAAGVNSADELRQIGDAAKQMGKDSGAGAAEAAVGLEGLIKAGLSTQEAIGALPQILALARGQMLSMDEATTLVIKTVNQFGLSFADAKRVVDTLATGANVAATSVQDLAQGLETSGLQARQAGLSLQETIAALNTLIQNGQDAAGAGEALQGMLLELGDSGSAVREALRSVGVATGDFNAVLALLDKGGTDATAVINAFGESAGVAAGVFQTALPFYRQQAEQIRAVGTSAQDAAAILGNTFNAQVQKLTATWGEFWQTLSEPVLPALTESLQAVTGFINDNRQALSDWITTIASPLTGTIDLLRYAVAQWNGDTEKAAQINQQMNERLDAVGRALSNTSAEYAKARVATEGQAAATDAAARATDKQALALLALQDAMREHARQAAEAAQGSELQRFHLEQVRLAQARYRTELDKGVPAARENAQTQQAAAKSLDQLSVAVQVAAAQVERLREQQRQGLATDQQVANAKLALKRVQDDYNGALRLGVDRAEAAAQAHRGYLGELERLANAQLDGVRTEIQIARAKGDTATAAQKSVELAQLELRWAQALAEAKKVEIQAQIALTQAKVLELGAIKDKTAAQQTELAGLQLRIQALQLELQLQQQQQQLQQQQLQQIQQNTEQIEQNTEGLQGNTREVQRNTQSVEENAKSYTRMEDAATGALRELSGLSDGMNALISHMLRVNDIGESFGHNFRGELGQLRLQMEQVNQAIEHNRNIIGPYFDAFERNVDIANQARKAYLEQAIAATELAGRLKDASDSADTSAATLRNLVSEAEHSINGMELLDQQTLDRLKGEIESANDKLREMQQEAEDARANIARLNAEIAAESGDSEKAALLRQQLDYQQALADIQAKRSQAELEGNRELVALYDEQIRKLEELNDLKTQNIKADAKTSKTSGGGQTTASTQPAAQLPGGSGAAALPGGSTTVHNTFLVDPTALANEEWIRRNVLPTINKVARLRG